MKIAESKSTKLPLYFWFEVITLWGLMSILIWLILRPKHPVYKVVDVYISHLDARNSTFYDGRNLTFQHGWNSTVNHSGKYSTFHRRSNSSHQNISIILEIEISNPNKKIGIYHDDIKVALHHNDSFIGNNSIAGFHQGYSKTTFCEVKVNADQQSWEGIMDRRVNLKICLKSGVQYVYDIFRYRTNRHQLDTDAYMSIGSDGGKSSGEMTPHGRT
ncbi:NDR1/HIN1-like protein 2 [Durio zibethinus]|uniref:NDR1/HIN1-like protein 2 n=1 Tax=Durio zibethinus TaxID=66656 RepID=A0A6P5WF18_DURZI|nr:NDR1/HIN1-like protein 2 [Durio zibethinus]